MLPTILIAALQRITRKPWPKDHCHGVTRHSLRVPTGQRELYREFYDPKNGFVTYWLKTEAENNPLWKPEWADYENNACDCPKCIAIRALDDYKEELSGLGTELHQEA